MFYRTKQVRKKVYDGQGLFTGEVMTRWFPQFSWISSGQWRSHADAPVYGYETAEGAEEHLNNYNKNWQSSYQGRIPLKGGN